MKLTNPSDRELNATFAEVVAGFHNIRLSEHSGSGLSGTKLPGEVIDAWHANPLFGIPSYTIYFDAVLPWLEEMGWRGTSNRSGSTCAATVMVLNDNGVECFAVQDDIQTKTPLARAAVIALLRARGVEIGS